MLRRRKAYGCRVTRRLLFLLLVPGGVLIYGAYKMYRRRDFLACRLGFRRHDPVREMTAAGPIYRCQNCQKASASLIELTDPQGEDRVSLRRLDQSERLHGDRRIA